MAKMAASLSVVAFVTQLMFTRTRSGHRDVCGVFFMQAIWIIPSFFLYLFIYALIYTVKNISYMNLTSKNTNLSTC